MIIELYKSRGLGANFCEKRLTLVSINLTICYEMFFIFNFKALRTKPLVWVSFWSRIPSAFNCKVMTKTYIYVQQDLYLQSDNTSYLKSLEHTSLCIHSRFSHFMLAKKLLLINHEICYKTVNLNSLEISYDPFPSMSSPNFRLSGGSLGYWTACNNFKRYCTLPYCEIWKVWLKTSVVDTQITC